MHSAGGAVILLALALTACSGGSEPTGGDGKAPRDGAPAGVEPALAEAGPLRVPVTLRVVSAGGAPLPDATAMLQREGPLAGTEVLSAAGDGRIIIPPLDLPLAVFLLVAAPGHVPARLAPVALRCGAGSIDLGDITLTPGETYSITVIDAAGAPVPGAAIHRLRAGTPFPPRFDTQPHTVQTQLDPTTAFAWTDAAGSARVVAPPADRNAFVTADGFPPTPIDLAAGTVVLPDGVLLLRVEAAPSVRLVEGAVCVRLDLGGVTIERSVPPGRVARLLLDRPRPTRLLLDRRGYRSVDLFLDEPPAEPVVIALAPLALEWGRFEAVAADTGQQLPVASLRLGRARDDQSDRIDFVPDWNCLDRVSEGEALGAAPAGHHDVLISAPGYLETLERGVALKGTERAPGVVRISLEPAPPVAGRVVDGRTGLAVPGARVFVRRTSRDLEDLPLLWRLAGTVGFVGAVRTGADGNFLLTTSARENLALEVAAKGYAPLFLPVVERAATASLILRLDRGHTVSGAVSGEPEGAPWRTTVYLRQAASGLLFSTPAGADRSFRFENVPAGTFRIYADRDDRALFSGRWPALEVVLAHALHATRGNEVDVRGNVDGLALERGDPIPRPVLASLGFEHGEDRADRATSVRLDERLPARGSVTAAVRARTALAVLAEGRHALVIEDGTGNPLAVTEFTAAFPTTRVTVDCRPAGLEFDAAASGRCRAIARSPLLAAAAARAPGWTRFATVELEDAGDGRFLARDLPGGRWVVELLDASGSVFWSRAVSLEPGETLRIRQTREDR